MVLLRTIRYDFVGDGYTTIVYNNDDARRRSYILHPLSNGLVFRYKYHLVLILLSQLHDLRYRYERVVDGWLAIHH